MIETQTLKTWIKRILFYGLFAATFLFGSQALAEEPVKLVVEGTHLDTPVPPQIVAGRTIVPVRVVTEALGATVEWDGEKRQVIIKKSADTVVLTIGQAEALINGRPAKMDVPAQIVNDRTMVPLRFVGEAFGATFEWDGASRTVQIFRRPSKIVDMKLVKEVGKARVDLLLDEPVLTWKQKLNGNAIELDLYPAVVAMQTPVRLLGDPLVRGLVAFSGDSPRQARFMIDLWRKPRYEVKLAEDGKTISFYIEYDVTGLQFQMDGYVPTVLIAANGPLNYNTIKVGNPDRVVVDIADAVPTKEVAAQLPVGHSLIKQIRSSHYSKDPDSTRVVIDLATAHAYEVTRTDAGLLVRFTPRVSNVGISKLAGKTRITLTGTQPLGGQVSADPTGKKLRIEVPRAISTVSNPLIKVGDGTINTIAVGPGTTPESLVVTVDLPYYLGHQLVSKATDTNLVVDLITSPIYGRKIWVDAGHGGRDGGAPGATYGFNLEKLVALQTSLELKKVLEEAGATVLMTRTTDITVELVDRTKAINAAKPDVMISVHYNSTGTRSGAVRGTETYWYTAPSKPLATLIHAALLKGTQQPDRGVRQESFHMIRETKAPSVLLEIGFLDNPTDEKLARDPAFQKKAALAIRQGLFNYFTALTTPSQPR